MTLLVTFEPTTPMSAKQYRDVLQRLEERGAGTPKGRLQHYCYGPTNALRVIDVWQDQATFDAFGAVLMPILASVGLSVGEPNIQPLHNAIAGR